MTFDTSNSPTTRHVGLVMYTTTISTALRKIALRNSKRFSPRNIASAYCGLIDNKAKVCFREVQDLRELSGCDDLEAPWGRLDATNDAIID